MNFRIFICYSQSDFFETGNKIRSYLSDLFPDAHVYIDQIKSKGQKWKIENERELRTSDLVIAIMTPGALQSEAVEREIKIAQETKKIILPCKDKTTNLEWEDLPFGLGEIEGIKFENEEKLQRELFSEIKKIRIEFSKSTLESKKERKNSIFVQVDKASYSEGEIILVTGEVVQLLGGYALSLTVIAPNGNLVAIDQFTVGADKKFSATISAGGALMKTKGTYTVTVQYGGNKNNSATTSFEFGKSEKEPKRHFVALVVNSSTPESQFCIPEILKIKVGDIVKWINGDSGIHTITSGSVDDFSPSPSGVFDSGIMMPNSSYEVTFKEKSTHNYYCMLHPWKECTIIVD